MSLHPNPHGLDTSWLDEVPPGGQAATEVVVTHPVEPVQQTVPVVRPAPISSVPPRHHVDVLEPEAHRRINWSGIPGRVSMARYSFGRTLAGTVPIVLVTAVLLLVAVRWLFGVWSGWAVLPAVLLGGGWLVIAGIDAVRYALRGGPPPPVL